MKIDLHVHTRECSGCATLYAKEMLAQLKEAGLDAVMISNHYGKPHQEWRNKNVSTETPDVYFVRGWEIAKAEAEKIGLKVFFGAEFHPWDSNNDFLVFGMEPSDVLDYENHYKMNIREFVEHAHSKGWLVYQAHPFRTHMRIEPVGLLDGIEAINANPRHDSRNDIAQAWAKKYNLKTIACSDSHEEGDSGLAYIETERNIETMDDLLDMLRTEDYKLVRGEKYYTVPKLA